MIDLRSIGRHMSRDRYQRGSLSKVGKRRKMWQGLWHVYVKQPDGTEKRLPRTKVLGPATLSRAEAQKLLNRRIEAASGIQESGSAVDARFTVFRGLASILRIETEHMGGGTA